MTQGKVIEILKKIRHWATVGVQPKEIAEGLDAAIQTLERQKWIPVKERLPEKPSSGLDSYIVQTENVIAPFDAYWDGEHWVDLEGESVDPIAWMPLPESYREEKRSDV